MTKGAAELGSQPTSIVIHRDKITPKPRFPPVWQRPFSPIYRQNTQLLKLPEIQIAEK